MAWICLTLIRITEVSGNAKYRDTAREVFDRYIWPRRVKVDKGTGLPWTNHAEDQKNLNACTNSPSCLVAAKLYEAYKDDGGNSVIDEIAPRIRKLPLEPPKEA